MDGEENEVREWGREGKREGGGRKERRENGKNKGYCRRDCMLPACRGEVMLVLVVAAVAAETGRRWKRRQRSPDQVGRHTRFQAGRSFCLG
jgi:hypothetical protein